MTVGPSLRILMTCLNQSLYYESSSFFKFSCSTLVPPFQSSLSLRTMHASFASFLILTSAVEAQLIFGNPACYADNCARAITGSAGGPLDVAGHTSDCSNFMQQTVTVPEETVTVCGPVVNATMTVHPTRDVIRRQQYYEPPYGQPPLYEPPRTIPSYVPITCGEYRYTSACVCWNITASTKTVFHGVSQTRFKIGHENAHNI